jgi:hypothetical protein
MLAPSELPRALLRRGAKIGSVACRIAVLGALSAEQGNMYVVMAYLGGATSPVDPTSTNIFQRLRKRGDHHWVGATPVAMVCRKQAIIGVVDHDSPAVLELRVSCAQLGRGHGSMEQPAVPLGTVICLCGQVDVLEARVQGCSVKSPPAPQTVVTHPGQLQSGRGVVAGGQGGSSRAQ